MDLRLKSKLQLCQLDPEPSNDALDVESHYEEAELKFSQSSVRWVQLRKLGSTIYPTNSPHGNPTTVVCGSKYLAIGTFSAEILFFDYEQNLVAQLSPHKGPNAANVIMGPVMSLAFSSDESHVVAGFGLGGVSLIELDLSSARSRVLTTIYPLASDSAEENKLRYQETHCYGIPVVKCAFLTGKNRMFVSLDASGILIAHKYHRVMLEFTHKSRRILGSYQKPMLILSSSISNNMIALLTPELLEVLWINAQGAAVTYQEVVRISRNRDALEEPSGQGMACFRKGEYASSHSQVQYNLIYSWGSDLELLHIDMAKPPPQCVSIVCGYKHHSPIIQAGWLKQDLVVLFSSEGDGVLDFVDLNDAKAIDQERLPASMKLKLLVVSGYSIFVLGKHEFSVGKLANWADRLLSFVNNGQPAAAVKLALKYYESGGDLSIIDLPSSDIKKKAAVRKALPDLILTTVQFSAQYDQESLKTLLPEAIEASAVTKVDILESILDIVDQEQWARELYLATLTKLVMKKKLLKIPAAVFKELLLHTLDPRVFYNLDLSTLDLDLAFDLCSKHPESLAEAKIFLQNNCLQDYISPLKDAGHVFEYLAMTLTSRAYPIGTDLPEECAAIAKTKVYQVLFMEDDNLGLLKDLLTWNERAFYMALNEAFEDPWLNSNTEISRQTILNLLIDHYLVIGKMSISFCVFIARNYPKYSQFIVIQETYLQKVVDQLCQGGDQDSADEVQMALLSILAVHKPRDMSAFIEKLSSARFMLVLHHVLRKRGQLLEFVELKLSMADYDEIWSILEECMSQTRTKSVRFIVDYLEELKSIDVEALARLVVLHNVSEVWQEILKSDLMPKNEPVNGHSEQKNLEFIGGIFEIIHERGGRLPPMDVRVFYIQALASLETQRPDKLIYLLNEILTGPNDVELPRVVDSLSTNQRTDALAIILCRKNRKAEASIYLRNTIRDLAAGITKDSQKPPLNWYIKFACNICLEVSQSDKDVAQVLCQELIETLAECGLVPELNDVTSIIIESNLIDISRIAQLLLIDSNPKVSKLSRDETPRVISQIYSSLARSEQGLRCFLEIVLKEGHHQYLQVLAGRSQGWIVPVEGECEICGRKVVGLGINAKQLYLDWRSSMNGETNKDDITLGLDTNGDGTSLLSFQCGHHYHYRCHQRMINARSCVICERNAW